MRTLILMGGGGAESRWAWWGVVMVAAVPEKGLGMLLVYEDEINGVEQVLVD